MACSGTIGLIYGGAAVQPLGLSTEGGLLAAILTAVGGMVPDLDSDTSVPMREMTHLAAVVLPIMAVPRLLEAGWSREAVITAILASYVGLRLALPRLLQRLTVHRGMFHSIPAAAIAGLAVYVAYGGDDLRLRLVLAAGVTGGYLSHLVLDEVYAVDWRGLVPKLKPSAGSALKFSSPSYYATGACYALLGILLYLAVHDTLWRIAAA